MDWQLTCRVCLETGDMVSLFDWDENNEQLADKYTYCCGIEVSKNDSLPTLICLNCVDRLTFSYQFKQQCLSSNDTLKECLDEFTKTSAATAGASTSKSAAETETITIKQENGVLLQYDLPVEHEPTWTRTLTKSADKAVITKAPEPKKRGRPRKYPNEQGQIDVSPYHRKKPKVVKPEHQSLTSLINFDSEDMKKEPSDVIPEEEEDQFADNDFPDDDPDFEVPDGEQPSDDDIKIEETQSPRKRGRPRKHPDGYKKPTKPKKDQFEGEGEDVLLKETILAFSEPIPEHILNPKPKEKKKYKYEKKKYQYEKTHTCETCGSSFTSNASLQAHIRRHLGIKPFVCSVCGYACVQSMELRRHMFKHTGVKPYKCRICDRRFGDFGSRQKHESVCGKTFTWKLGLSRHMAWHLNVRKYKCQFCERTFVELGDKQRHESVCGKTFTWKLGLSRHMAWHLNVRKYKCQFCERTFVELGDKQRHESICGYSCVLREALKRHMLRHTGEKPYKCRVCDRRFGDFGTRQKHERLHMGVRPYQCSVCGKAFTYSYVLANHMLTHTGEKKYSCTPCNKKFTKAHHLKYHNKVHHKDIYVQQQLEMEAKKVRQQINVSGLSGVISGQIVDGKLQLVQMQGEGTEQMEGDVEQMQVVEIDQEHKETDRAVADMQAVVMESEFCIEDDK